MILTTLMKTIPFFEGFTSEERAVFTNNDSFFVAYNDGDYLVREGNETDRSLYILIKGAAAVTKENYPLKVITVLKPGDIVGETSFLTDRPRTANVIAQNRAVAFKIDQASLNQLNCPLQIKIRDQLIEILVERLDKMTKATIELL